MTVAVIYARDLNFGIGQDGGIPWRAPGDLLCFKSLTMGEVVIMGRRTYESLPHGALHGRVNIVITRVRNHIPEGDPVLVVPSLECALRWARDFTPEKTVYVIGGADLIDETIDKYADSVYETVIMSHTRCDVFLKDRDLLEWGAADHSLTPQGEAMLPNKTIVPMSYRRYVRYDHNPKTPY